jgi:hypothetical protein
MKDIFATVSVLMDVSQIRAEKANRKKTRLNIMEEEVQ